MSLENEGDCVIKNKEVRRIAFRFRLWMLFPLFIPAAFIAIDLRNQLREKFYCTESAEEFFKKDHEFLAIHSKDTAWVPDQNLNDEFIKQGVSLSYGRPESFPDSHRGSWQPKDPTKYYVGVSGYPLKLNGQSKPTLSCIESGSALARKFRGPMMIAFHKPDQPEVSEGAFRVGFYLTRIDNPGDAQISLYSSNGKLMKQFTNSTEGTVFMGIESAQPIGWLEINMIGKDDNYALGELSFSKTRVDPTSSNHPDQ